MSHNDEVGLMTDEVIRDIRERKVRFNIAFSWAAHRRGLRHCEDRHRYNYFFKAVLGRYKQRNRPSLVQALQGPRPWQYGKILRDHPPAKGRFYKRDPWETHDPNNSFFPDNEGYLHNPNSPYLQGFPER